MLRSCGALFLIEEMGQLNRTVVDATTTNDTGKSGKDKQMGAAVAAASDHRIKSNKLPFVVDK